MGLTSLDLDLFKNEFVINKFASFWATFLPCVKINSFVILDFPGQENSSEEVQIFGRLF